MQLGRSCRCWTAQRCSTRALSAHVLGLHPLKQRLGSCSTVQRKTAARLNSSSPQPHVPGLDPHTSQRIRVLLRSSHDSSAEPQPSQQQQPEVQQQQQPVWDLQQQQHQQQRPGLLQHVYTVLGSLALLIVAAGMSARPSYAAGIRPASWGDRRLVPHQMAPSKAVAQAHCRHQPDPLTSDPLYSASSDQSGPSDTPGSSKDYHNHARSQPHDAINDTEPIRAWAWFSNTFCRDGKYREGSSTVVPWQHFWTELRNTARSKGLNEVCWSYVDHGLSQTAQQELFKANLWRHVKPLKRNSITAAEFKAAVKKFSPVTGSMADLIESIMLDAPDSRTSTHLSLRDQAFISHTGSDQDKWRSVALTTSLFHELWYNKQLLAFYDTHALKTGCRWREKIRRCVCSSKVVVVVLSPDYFSRYWCMHELDLALNAEPQLGRRVIIPVLLGVDRDWIKQVETYMQKWQQMKQVSSLTGAERTQLLDRWKDNLKKLDDLQAPEAEPLGKDWQYKRVLPLIVPEVQKHIAAVLSPEQWGPLPLERLPSAHFVLPEHNTVNTTAFNQLAGSIDKACNEQVEAIEQAAGTTGRPGAAGAAGASRGASDSTWPPVLQLQGMAGMGKSTLALQLAEHYEDTVGCFSGSVFFLRVPSQGSKSAQSDDASALDTAVRQLQVDLLDQLQPAIEVSNTSSLKELSPDALHWKLTQAFASTHMRRLTHFLVLDGVWDKAFIQQLRCRTMRGVILVTSRESMPGVAADNVFSLQADRHSCEAARGLMMEVVGEKHMVITKDQQAVIDKVLEKCDGNMSATNLMAVALRDRKASWWTAVKKEFMERVQQSDKPLVSAIQTTVDTLAGAGRDRRAALQAFEMLQHLNSQLPLPMPLLQLLWSTLHPSEPADVNFLLDQLWRASLVCRKADSSYYTQAVVAEFLANQPPATNLPGGLSAKDASPALRKLAVLLLGYGRPDAVKWAQQLFGVEPVDGVAVSSLGYLPDWAGEESEVPFTWEPEGRLCSRVGILLRNSGLYKQAEPWLTEALEKRRVLGEHADVAASLNHLALLLQDQDKLLDAKRTYQEALNMWQNVRGRKHQETATTLNNLAWLLVKLDLWTDAESTFREALSIRQEVLQPQHPMTASSLNDLAWLLHTQGKALRAQGKPQQAHDKLKEAESKFEQALNIRKKVLGPEHPNTITTITNLRELQKDLAARDYDT